MFSIKYQLFLNDIYFWGSTELLTYAMTKRYLEDIDFLLSTQKQIRFNQRMNRLYLDIDWSSVSPNNHLVIDCYRGMNPDTHTKVWNDSFLKRYAVQLIKRQWGPNMIKFQGMKLPGGVELNGRKMYDDAEKELQIIGEQMSNTYELPPFDMIDNGIKSLFLQGSKGEQDLMQDLINESIKTYGVEVHYMPRLYLGENTVIKKILFLHLKAHYQLRCMCRTMMDGKDSL